MTMDTIQRPTAAHRHRSPPPPNQLRPQNQARETIRMTHLQTAQAYFDRRAAGDVAGCLELVSPNIRFESAKDGVFEGIDGFKSGLSITDSVFKIKDELTM